MRKIGIGAFEDINKVVEAAREAVSDEIFVVIYAPDGTHVSAGDDLQYHISPDPAKALIDALLSGTIDGAVRGTLPSGTTLRYLREAASVNHLERIAVLETPKKRKFLLTPVGIDEGWTIGDKLKLARNAQELAERIGIDTTIGILSGGRLGDIGRNVNVDRSLAEAELLARLTGGVHSEILIEDAARKYGIVIAPDGISGNLIFRTLVLLGLGGSHGAPVVNIDVTFVDTSRASVNYGNALRLAASLVKNK